MRRIKAAISDLALDFDCEIIDPGMMQEGGANTSQELHEIRGRRGISKSDAVELLNDMVRPNDGRKGGADGYLGGVSHNRHRQALLKDNRNVEDAHRVVGSYMMTVGAGDVHC